MYYDREGKPLSLDVWALRFEDNGYKIIKQNTVKGCFISTVWLGIDHNFSHDGPPVIFETMIFGGPHNEEQWRYCTEAQSRAGHREAIELVRRDMTTPHFRLWLAIIVTIAILGGLAIGGYVTYHQTHHDRCQRTSVYNPC